MIRSQSDGCCDLLIRVSARISRQMTCNLMKCIVASTFMHAHAKRFERLHLSTQPDGIMELLRLYIVQYSLYAADCSHVLLEKFAWESSMNMDHGCAFGMGKLECRSLSQYCGANFRDSEWRAFTRHLAL